MNRNHTYFNAALINGFPYLKENIKSVSGDTKSFICEPCKKAKGANKKHIFFFENLSGHLGSRAHRRTSQNELEIDNALNYIQNRGNQIGERNPSPERFIEETKTLLVEGAIEEELMPSSDLFPIQDDNDFFKLQMTNFILQNNLPFSLSEKLLQFLRELCKLHSSRSLLNFTFDRKQLAFIASDCIRPYVKKKYCEILANTPFSISLDAGNAKGNTEFLAISARYLEGQFDTKTVTKLLGLVQIKGSTTGKSLFEIVNDFLFNGHEAEKRRKNMMGVATDGASNMRSARDKGLTNRLQQEMGHIYLMHDFCHAMNLVLQKSIKSFPGYYLDIVKKISKTFSKSPQRAAKLKELAKHFPDREKKVFAIKTYVKTRWSSFGDCLERILELKDPLKEFFEGEGKDDAKNYFENDNVIMLNLLLCLIKKVDYYIKFFQGDNLDIIDISRKLRQAAVSFGEYLFDLSGISNHNDFEDSDLLFSQLEPKLLATGEEENSQSYLENKKSIGCFLGFFIQEHPEFEFVFDSSMDFQEEFFSAAFNFCSTAFTMLKKYISWDSSNVILLVDGFLLKNQGSLLKLRNLATKFNNVIPSNKLTDFNLEVTRLKSDAKILSQKIANSNNFLKAWYEERLSYPLVYDLARSIQVLPYSSACIERCFSVMGDVKTNKRNRLGAENLEASLLLKQEFQNGQFLSKEIFSQYKQLLTQDEKTEVVDEGDNEKSDENQCQILTKKESSDDVLKSLFLEDNSPQILPSSQAPGDYSQKFFWDFMRMQTELAYYKEITETNRNLSPIASSDSLENSKRLKRCPSSDLINPFLMKPKISPATNMGVPVFTIPEFSEEKPSDVMVLEETEENIEKEKKEEFL